MPQLVPSGRQYEQKEFKVGLAPSAVWHTPVSVNAGRLDFCEAVNLPIVGPARIPDPGIGRQFGQYNPPLGKIECAGDLVFTAATYGQIDYLFAAAFGDDQVTGTGPYVHSLTPWPTVWGHMFTVAYQFRGYDSVEFPSVKVQNWELTAAPGEVAKVKFDCMADFASVDITGTLTSTAYAANQVTVGGAGWVVDQFKGLSVVIEEVVGTSDPGTSRLITGNTSDTITYSGTDLSAAANFDFHVGGLNAGGDGGTFESMAGDDYVDRLHFDDLLVMLGPDGAPLTNDHCMNVGEIKINFERPMTGDFKSTCSDANAIQKHAIFQPRDTGITKLTAEITWPNYDEQTKYAVSKWLSTSPQSVRLEFLFNSPLGGVWHLSMPGAFISGNPIQLPLTGGMPATIMFEATYGPDDISLPGLDITNNTAGALFTGPGAV